MNKTRINNLRKHDIVKVEFSERHYYLKIYENTGKHIGAYMCNYNTGRVPPNTVIQIASYDECEKANMHKIGEFVPIFDRIKTFSLEPVKYII